MIYAIKSINSHHYRCLGQLKGLSRYTPWGGHTQASTQTVPLAGGVLPSRWGWLKSLLLCRCLVITDLLLISCFSCLYVGVGDRDKILYMYIDILYIH